MQKHLYSAILFLFLAAVAGAIYLFVDPSFGKGLFVGLAIALGVYILRQFLPNRES